MPAKAMQSLFAESMVLTEEILQRTKTEIYEAGVDPRLDELAAPLVVYDNPEFDNVRATMKKLWRKTRLGGAPSKPIHPALRLRHSLSTALQA